MPFMPIESEPNEQAIAEDVAEETEVLPSRTWEFDFNAGEFTGRKINRLDAYGQAMRKALITERDVYPIYGDGYGSELHLLIGDGTYTTAYKESEAMDMAEEAIIYDDRTLQVLDISANSNGDRLDLNISVEVDERISFDNTGIEVNLGG